MALYLEKKPGIANKSYQQAAALYTRAISPPAALVQLRNRWLHKQNHM